MGNAHLDRGAGGGFTAYVLLTLAVALGLALSLRWRTERWPRLITNDLHRFLTLLSLAFVAIHGLAVWLDPFVRFGWTEVLVPWMSHYRPLWMALGAHGARHSSAGARWADRRRGASDEWLASHIGQAKQAVQRSHPPSVGRCLR